MAATYSIVEGGYSGTGNLNSDPLFVNAQAPSSAPTTGGDYHLQAGSPAADAGSSAALPADAYDLDGDSNTAETLPYDRDSQARVLYSLVDMGADEADYCSSISFPYTATSATGLSAAITCANANATSDTINLTNSIYSFGSADSANPDNALPIITSQVTINGNGATIQRSGASTSFRLVYIASGALSLNNLTVSGGSTGGSPGGGIYNGGGTLTIANSTIANNSIGTSSITSIGGGILNNGTLKITNSTISGNSANIGGGVFNWSGTATISNSTVSGNTATDSGGGLFNNGAGSTLTVVDSTIAGNVATAYGAGVRNSSSASLILVNTTIAGNASSGSYGAIINDNNGSITMQNSTVAANSDTSGGGTVASSGAFTIVNSIIWNNSRGIVGSFSISYSIVAGGASGTGNLSSDPLFVNAQAPSSAPTTGGDYHLQAGSPARDTGSSAALPADTYDLDGDSDTGEPLPHDLDGARISGTAVDMGAYEARFAAVISITRSSPISATTAAASVTFQVVFDRALVGIDASDLAATLVSGNLSGASVTAVSGSGATYSVTVGNGTGSGVLRLDILATARATARAGLPVGLPAYAGGESYTIDRDAPGAPAISGIITDAGGQASGSTTDPTISLNGTAEPASTVALTRLGVGVIGTATADVNGDWVFDYTATPLALGSHVFTATATDASGNTSSSSDPFTVTVRTGTVWYVDHDATGANTGSSWADAFTSLQAALAVGNTGDQLWVAAGSYKPGATGDRDATFALRTGLAVYGGFAGSETALVQRDWTTNVVTLTGDLNGDDGANFANNGENSYHVVTGAADATLDGFTITGGNAGSGNGGGIYASGGSLALGNLIVAGNTAANGGSLYGSQISATFANVTFSGNSATNGGGMYILDSSLALMAAAFSGNTATASGGGLVSRTGSAVLDGVTFSGNSAGGGGGLFSFQSAVTLTNMIFSGNSATFGGGLNINTGSSALLTGATFTGNTATSNGGGFYTVSTAVLTGTSFVNNTSQSVGAIYSGSAGAIRISASTLSGTSAIVGGGIHNRGSITIVDTSFSGNSATNGGGAISLAEATSALTLTDSLLSDNIAAGDGGLGAGGGIQIAAGTAMASNVTFSGNQANGAQDDGGGAIVVYAGGLSLANVTIAGNSTTSSGGGISIDGSTAVVTLTNTIVAGNAAVTGRPDLSGALVSGGHNLIGDSGGGTGFTNGPSGDLVGTSAAPLDPLLSALGGYGSAATAVTQTLALLPGSPAIDAGNSAACPAADQRGVARSQGSGCDIGAFESRGFTLGIAGGNNQVTTVGSAFALPLAVQVTANAAGEPVGPGGSITWSGPASGAGLSTPVITGTTTLGGSASVSVAANSTAGSCAVTATARGAAAMTFNLQQTAAYTSCSCPVS